MEYTNDFSYEFISKISEDADENARNRSKTYSSVGVVEFIEANRELTSELVNESLEELGIREWTT